MNIEDLRKLREQIESGEALVRPESVIVEVIDRAIAAEAQVAALREALEMASEAMNHMGDIANSMDIVEEEDNIATDAAFALVDRVLTDTDTAAAAEAHDARVRADARREVLRDLLMLCNRSATEAAAEGRKFSLDIHQGYENWAEEQLAALEAETTKGEV